MPRFFYLLPLLFLAACSTFDDRELARMRADGVPPRVVAKLDRGDPATPADLLALARAGVPESFALRHLEDAGVDYLVTRDDAVRLRRGGVSARVIDALLVESDRFAADHSAGAGGPDVGVSVGTDIPLEGDIYFGW